MSDWWSKKLAGEKPTQERRFTHPATNFPPTTPVTTPTVTQTNTAPVDTTPAVSFTEALQKGITNGGEATRRETQKCPSCGGGFVFTRAKGTMVNGASPAPRCYECGWNGLYEQAEQSNWA